MANQLSLSPQQELVEDLMAIIHCFSCRLYGLHNYSVVEDLNVSGMMQNEKLAQAIADCGFAEFRRQLEYKCEKFGCKLIIADQWYPSSKTCSCCGHKKEKLFLSERIFTCS